jgi:hypothetical protein
MTEHDFITLMASAIILAPSGPSLLFEILRLVTSLASVHHGRKTAGRYAIYYREESAPSTFLAVVVGRARMGKGRGVSIKRKEKKIWKKKYVMHVESGGEAAR